MNPVSVKAFDIFSSGEISECDSECVSVAESVMWSSALVSNDIFVPPSDAVNVVGVGVSCRTLFGNSSRSVALLMCRVCLWFLMWVRLPLLL